MGQSTNSEGEGDAVLEALEAERKRTKRKAAAKATGVAGVVTAVAYAVIELVRWFW